jgi:transposase
VIAYGTPLVEDPGRIGEVTALGLDETLFCRQGRWRRQQWCTSIVDLTPGRGAQLLDVVAGRDATGPTDWLEGRTGQWRQHIRYGVLDLSGPYRKTFEDSLDHVTQVADPFHLVKVRHEALCVRGWVRGPPHRSVAAGR